MFATILVLVKRGCIAGVDSSSLNLILEILAGVDSSSPKLIGAYVAGVDFASF